MSFTPKSTKHESESPSPSPLAGGHKGSFRGTKLARRARSFKEDFLEKISQMRSPGTAHASRAHSPKPPGHGKEEDEKVCSMDMLIRQVQVALKHFRDVITKNKLEMLSGNGTIVLETIYMILSALKPHANERSATVSSATQHVYQCLGRLIKLCDDVMVHGDKSAALDSGNVTEIVSLLEDSVQNLIKISQDKYPYQPYKTTPRNYGSTLEHPAQRNSLPDIPLTPQDRMNLEQNACTPGMVRSSHSSESILRDSSPPPKPPLPDRQFVSICLSEPDSNSLGTPPPLPPKKRNQRTKLLIGECCNSDSSLLAGSLDRMSLRSRSPEDSSSLLSASGGSLDSVLNHSREEDEIKAIMDHHNEDGLRDNDLSEHLHGFESSFVCDDSLCSTSISHFNQSDIQVLFDNNRLSNTDSGFASIHSHRNSIQSYSTSKRSSQQSSSSQYSQQNSSRQTYSLTETKTEHIKTEKLVFSEENFVLDGVGFLGGLDSCLPPAIPQKTRSRKGRCERQPSPYDNVSESLGGELVMPCSMHQAQSKTSARNSQEVDENEPPPLPVKKRHMFQSVAYSVMAYMEMFGNCAHTTDNEYLRHSVHMVQQWQNQKSLDSGLSSTQSCSFMHTSSHTLQQSTLTLPNMDHSNLLLQTSPTKSPLPPALPPKRSRPTKSLSPPSTSPTLTSTPNHIHLSPKTDSASPISATSTPVGPIKAGLTPPDISEVKSGDEKSGERDRDVDRAGEDTVGSEGVDLMEEIDIAGYLVFKKPEEDGPDLRGGYIDALIVHATKCNKKEKEDDYSYQEAFLTTYRTFISPYELVQKLIKRHDFFICQPEKKPKAREAFSLLVSVVSDLTAVDLEDCLAQKLMDFSHQLITSGNLDAAKPLRRKLIEKYDIRQSYVQSMKRNLAETSLSLAAGSATLLDFKSEQIAEQMTLLDANLFMKIEIPEVLIWAQEQNEERSPNLTKFTEHFNKMSYWARTKILSPQDPREREKFVMKFIKIMKHLRKINNFNSYLALLSALDSAPIRRLEWQKHITEGLKEYCALIDSSSSFRAYRQALADTTPPCIPYIGLVLQDLTFVHIGNSNLLTDGTINFSKRWQQFNILENMKRFKKCSYSFKKNERIIAFFDNFQENIGEDAMWQLSESYKPRGGKKPPS